MAAAKRLGSDGGLGLLVRLPIPWKQVGDFVGGVILKPGQHVSEPGLRIDVVHLAGLCRPPNYAERFWKQAAVCARLRPIERTSPQFHSA